MHYDKTSDTVYSLFFVKTNYFIDVDHLIYLKYLKCLSLIPISFKFITFLERAKSGKLP